MSYIFDGNGVCLSLKWAPHLVTSKTATLLTALLLVAPLSQAEPQTLAPAAQLQPSTCQLYVDTAITLNPEKKRELTQLGYSLKSVPALSQISAVRLAPLLNDNSFALVFREQRLQLWMGLTRGQWIGDWRPLKFDLPQTAWQDYACAQMKEQVHYYQGIRLATVHAVRLLNQTPAQAQPRWGETILTLERDYLIRKRIRVVSDSVQAYRDLLAKVRVANSGSKNNFFQDWAQVKKTLFANENFGLDYCNDNLLMTDALLKKCTNCQGETALFASLFNDAGFNIPDGWTPAIQIFSNHIQAVLYNSETQKVFALQTGQFANATALILPMQKLLLLELRRQNTLLSAQDIQQFAEQPLNPLYQSSRCGYANWAERPLQMLVFDGVPGCEDSPGANPEFSENSDRATSGITNAQEENAADSGNPFSQLLNGISGWFNQRKSPEASIAFSEAAALGSLANNLIPEERSLMLSAMQNGAFSDELTKRFSLRRFLEGNGLADQVLVFQNNIAASETGYNVDDYSVLPPLIVEQTERSYSAFLMMNLDVYAEWNRPLLRVYVRNEVTRKRLRNMSAAERTHEVLQILRTNQKTNADLFLNSHWPQRKVTDSLRNLPASAIQLSHFWYASNALDDLDWHIGMPLSRRFEPLSVQGSTKSNLAFMIPSEMNQISTKLAQFQLSMEANPELVLQYMNNLAVTSLPSLESSMKSLSLFAFAFQASVQDKVVYLSNVYQDDARYFDRFLSKVLHHKDFFFTVAPDEDEVPQPKAMDIRDLRIIEREVQASRPLPQINLPKIRTTVCEGKSSLSIQVDPASKMYVQCPFVMGQANASTDGQAQGTSTGENADRTAGTDSQRQDGVLDYADDGLGKDPKITIETKPGEPSAILDPRQEIHLNPQVIGLLVEVTSEFVFHESDIKILLHHTYRKKLQSVYANLIFNHRQVYTFHAVDFSSDPFSITEKGLHFLERRVNCVVSERECWRKIVPAWRALQAGLDQGQQVPARFRSSEFMQVAFLELVSQPKTGTKFISNGAASMDETALRYLRQITDPVLSISSVIQQAGGYIPRALSIVVSRDSYASYLLNYDLINATLHQDQDHRQDQSLPIMVLNRTGDLTGEPWFTIYQVSDQKVSFKPTDEDFIRLMQITSMPPPFK